jgi:membrane protease YdiL (CAAX protease family)
MGLRREKTFILFGEGVDHYSWRGVKWFFLTYFGAFLGAALVAPLIYMWIQGMKGPDLSPTVDYLQGKPISKFVDRVRLFLAALALLWMIKACGLWGRFGFHWSSNGPKSFAGYYVLGTFSLLAVLTLQCLMAENLSVAAVGFGEIVNVVFTALLAGLMISLLEEAIFRGMVLRMFYTALKPLPAVLLSALVFAAVHFKHVPNEVGMPFNIFSGFHVAAYQSVSFLLTSDIVEFINLFLVGLVLNLVFLKTGSLVGCMGLHAGWVLVSNTWVDLAEMNGGSTRILGSEDIVDGYASLILLLIIAVVLYAKVVKRQIEGQVVLGDLT